MSSANRQRGRSRALETAAIVLGLAGLALAVWRHFAEPDPADVVRSPPAKVRGERLDAIDTQPPKVIDAPALSSDQPLPTIPDASFELAAQLDGTVKRDNGTLTLERTSDGNHLKVPMSLLGSFAYRPQPHSRGAAQLGIPAPPPQSVPGEILDLDGKDAVLVGFMVPIDVDPKGVKEFVLSQNRSFCCYGVKPAINEMVVVRMQDGLRARFLKDTPIAVFGQFAVSEERQGGHVISLYRMRATEVADLVTYAAR